MEGGIMPAAFDDRERDAIRKRLLAAATEALGRGGLGAASVADLAAAASIAKGSFYAFYPSKEHLFMEALESVEARYRARFAEAVPGHGTPTERLERAFLAAFGMAESESALRWIDGSTMERLARALPPERIAEHAAADLRAMEALVGSWRAQGLLDGGSGTASVAGAGYAVFLVAVGLRELPEPLRAATRSIVAKGLALALAAPAPASGRGASKGSKR
jgi:AcrR family transcriptional regulator